MENKTQPYYQTTLQTPLGPMLAIASDTALCLLEFLDRKQLQRQIAGLKIKLMSDERVPPLRAIEKELALYFAGQLQHFNTPVQLVGTLFQQQVWRQLQTIPFAQTRSYLQMATAMRMSKAYRALANANGANRLAIILPCHRVINANGELGGYAGGLDRKSWLLHHEQNGGF